MKLMQEVFFSVKRIMTAQKVQYNQWMRKSSVLRKETQSNRVVCCIDKNNGCDLYFGPPVFVRHTQGHHLRTDSVQHDNARAGVCSGLCVGPHRRQAI